MSDRGLGWYVYCVIPARERDHVDGAAGVDPAHAVQLVDHRELCAVVSRVPLDEFGSEGLERNLEDLAWLKRTALAHNAVLARARDADAVIPFRTCTIFDTPARVATMLADERTYFLAQLARLRRRDEWAVKLFADRERLPTSAPGHGAAGSEPDAETTPGRAFIARKKLDRDLRHEALANARDAARKAHVDLCAHAAASVLLPPQHSRVSGRSGDMILNGAYLVERDAAAEFATAVNALRRRESPNGFMLELSGPFAPYNFVTPREAG